MSDENDIDEEMARLALHGSQTGIWMWDIRNERFSGSERTRQLIGFPEHGPAPTLVALEQRLHPEDKASVVHQLRRHLEDREECALECRLQGPDGRFLWLAAQGQAEWDAEGNPTRMAGLVREMEDAENNARALRAALDFQRLLMDANADLIFVKDEEYRIVQANQAFLNLYPATKRDRVIGYTTLEDYDEAQAYEFLAEDRKAFAQGMSEVVESIDFPTAGRRTLLTKKTRFTGADGRRFIIGVARDITELKQTEDALRLANEELEEFSYRTSHDLRSPVLSAAKLLDIVLQSIEAGRLAEASECIRLARGSLWKIRQLSEDILASAQLNHLEDAPEAIDIEDLVNKSLQKFTYLDGYERLRFSSDYGHQGAPMLLKRHVSLILENLLSNAIKYQDYAKPEASVGVSTVQAGNCMLLTVSDNGLGIPERCQQELFGMFRRFHPKTAFGSGLGLHMVRKSVTKLGGTIRYSGTGEGSTFTISIPKRATTIGQHERNRGEKKEHKHDED